MDAAHGHSARALAGCLAAVERDLPVREGLISVARREDVDALTLPSGPVLVTHGLARGIHPRPSVRLCSPTVRISMFGGDWPSTSPLR